MAYLLVAFGHETLQASDGAAGIEVARQEKPDLVLLDIHMPRMDGYEVVRQLRGDSFCPTIPIVAVTALAMVGDRERILASGFTGYIAKPIDPEAFSGQVQAFLDESPALPAMAPAQAAPAAPASNPSPGKTLAVVLFVDNVQTNIDLVQSILEPIGYTVFTALSVREGLELAHRIKPGLILSDVHMPHQDGYDFMRIVQDDPDLSKIPFVFLSSSVWSTREQEWALQHGARKFICRPIEPEKLLLELEGCLPRKSGA